MENIKIDRGPDGFYCSFFVGGQEYLGSLIIQTAYADFWGTECIIFKAKDKQFTFEDALGECWARNCEYSPEALRLIVSDFIESKMN